MFLMLALVLAQAVTGLFATDGDFHSGPLNDLISGRAGNQISEFHEESFNVLLLLIGLHIAAVLFYLPFKRQNLIAPMITGLKDDPDGTLEPISGSRALAAVLTLIVVAAAVYALVTVL